MSHVTLSVSPHRAASILLEPPTVDVAVPGSPECVLRGPGPSPLNPTERTYVSLKEGSSLRRSLWNSPSDQMSHLPPCFLREGAWRAGRQRL